MENFTIKGYRTIRGYDGDCMECTLYLDGKKYAQCFNDGHGGETMIDFYNLDDRRKVMDKKNGYQELCDIVDKLCDQQELKKDAKKGIVIECEYGWKIWQWKVQIPTLLKKYRNGLEVLQREYDRAVSEGNKVLNTEYLASVGVKV